MVRPWFVIPLLGLASGAVALGTHHSIESAVAIALLGAALAAAIRAFAGPSIAAAVSAGAGAALGVLGLLVLDAVTVRTAIGGAAAMFAICELARAKPPNASPLPAIGAALVAGVLDPAYVALVAVAGVHLVVAPWPRFARWMVVVPIAGVLAAIIAIIAGTSSHLGGLWLAWSGHAHHAVPVRAAIVRVGELLGPLSACAAMFGLAIIATRGRFAVASVAGVVALTALVTITNGVVDPPVVLVASLGAGVAIGRLAAMIRLPVGQTFLGATAGFVLVVVPAWSLVASL